jgi:hypothetical protein
MPKQLPVIPLATLLANSEYVKESHYTPRRTRKRKRSSGSKAHAPRKQTPVTQPEVALSHIQDEAKQYIVPVDTPNTSPRHVQDNPARQRRFIVQNVSVSVEVQADAWRQQAWSDNTHHAAPSDWQPEPPPPVQPPVQPTSGSCVPDAQPAGEDILKWVVRLIAFVVGLISAVLLWHIFL